LAADVDPARAMFTGDSSSNCLTLHVTGSDPAPGVRYDLLGVQNALLDQAPDRVIGHAKQLGRDREKEAAAALYRLDPPLCWSRHDDGYRVKNGPAFTPDGRTMYHTDALLQTVFVFDLTENRDPHAGVVTQLFLRAIDPGGRFQGKSNRSVPVGRWVFACGHRLHGWGSIKLG